MLRLAGLVNATVPGPLALLQVIASVLPLGSPSSLAVPVSDAPPGSVIVWFVPAFTVGGWFVGGGAATAKPVVVEALWTPVRTVAVRGPGAADAEIVSCAVADVGDVTVTGPNPPSGPPPTDTPGPKLACVEPCTKFVYSVTIAMDAVVPGRLLAGEIDVIRGGGLMVSDAFVLEKRTPVVVCPATDTR